MATGELTMKINPLLQAFLAGTGAQAGITLFRHYLTDESIVTPTIAALGTLIALLCFWWFYKILITWEVRQSD